jgi:hypothetical protein
MPHRRTLGPQRIDIGIMMGFADDAETGTLPKIKHFLPSYCVKSVRMNLRVEERRFVSVLCNRDAENRRRAGQRF